MVEKSGAGLLGKLAGGFGLTFKHELGSKAKREGSKDGTSEESADSDAVYTAADRAVQKRMTKTMIERYRQLCAEDLSQLDETARANKIRYRENLKEKLDKRKRDLSFETSYRQYKKHAREVELAERLIEPQPKKMTKRLATHILNNGYGSPEMKRKARKRNAGAALSLSATKLANAVMA